MFKGRNAEVREEAKTKIVSTMYFSMILLWLH